MQVIYEHGAGIVDDDARDAFVVRMVGYAEELTPARHREAVAERSVTLFDLADGMSELILTGATVLLHGIYDKATTHARTIIADRTGATADSEAHSGAEELDAEPAVAVNGRTMDQLRADVVTDLLLTRVGADVPYGGGDRRDPPDRADHRPGAADDWRVPGTGAARRVRTRGCRYGASARGGRERVGAGDDLPRDRGSARGGPVPAVETPGAVPAGAG